MVVLIGAVIIIVGVCAWRVQRRRLAASPDWAREGMAVHRV
jgi:hypothetical protein